MTCVHDDFGLYLILTDPVAGYEACTEAAVAEGVRFVQLRMKNSPRHEILATARRLRDITRNSTTLLVINDDVRIAQEADADGVHLGQCDMPIAEARKLWNCAGKIFGLSTHNEAQVHASRRSQPDYIGFGPVFPTPTKTPSDPVVGLERLSSAVKASSAPVVAIGGINESNLGKVLRAGARNFAVVRAVCAQHNPREAIRRLTEIWHRQRSSSGNFGRKG